MTTAEKQGKLLQEDVGVATELMCKLNSVGAEVANLPGVNAMTDVTGFGLLGHLIEVCEGSNVSAKLCLSDIPILNNIAHYISERCVPGGSQRNHSSYGHKAAALNNHQQALLCDPQTSGGLLISVSPKYAEQVAHTLAQADCFNQVIGRIYPHTQNDSGELVSIE